MRAVLSARVGRSSAEKYVAGARPDNTRTDCPTSFLFVATFFGGHGWGVTTVSTPPADFTTKDKNYKRTPAFFVVGVCVCVWAF